jgi:hypothetical protein
MLPKVLPVTAMSVPRDQLGSLNWTEDVGKFVSLVWPVPSAFMA